MINSDVIKLKPTETKKTQYVLVYGTLRYGRGNWDRILKGNAEHVLTDGFQGFRHTGGLAAQYTGKEEDFLVMDVFKIHEEVFNFTHTKLDNLEGVAYGGYEVNLVTFEHPTLGEIEAKFYSIERSKDAKVVSTDLLDYLKDSSPTTESYGQKWKEEAPTMYSYYQKEEDV